MLEFLEARWRDPDEGIWEVRGGRRALHPLEGDGLGRVRPRGEGRRGVRARRDRSTAGRRAATRCTREVLRRGLRRRAQHVHAVLRLEGARREPADDPARRLPPGRRPAGRRHRRRHRARADRATASCSATRPSERRRRAAAGRGRVPPLLVLAGRQPRPDRAASTRPRRCSSGCSGSPTTSACSPRSTTRRPSACSATSRRRSPTSRWSTPPATSRAPPGRRCTAPPATTVSASGRDDAHVRGRGDEEVVETAGRRSTPGTPRRASRPPGAPRSRARRCAARPRGARWSRRRRRARRCSRCSPVGGRGG